MSKRPPIPAFAYLRVSGASQVEKDGPKRQEAAIRAYAAASGYHIERVFFERAVCGENELADRPEFMRLLDSLNGVRTVLVEKLDRLARALLTQEHILADLKKREVTLISVAEPDLCSDDPTRTLMRQILGSFHQYEKAMLVAKLRSARDRIRIRTGRCEGIKPYGAHPRYPEEKTTLDRMREHRRGGWSYSDIARLLNNEGVRARLGGEWSASGVSSALRRRRG